MTVDQPASIATDGITITSTHDIAPDTYAVQGRRVNGNVTAVLSIDERGGDEYVNGRVVRVPQAVTTTWLGSHTDPSNPPIAVNGTAYVGHYAMTATGRYVGSAIDRTDGGKVTDNARAILHTIAAAVATLHTTPERIAARKLADADHAVIAAEQAVDAARVALRVAIAARDAIAREVRTPAS